VGTGVPEAMAYAGIAGLPPQAGLYTLVASMLIYALSGPRDLSLGGTSAVPPSSLVGGRHWSRHNATDASDSQTYQTYAAAFVLVVGLVSSRRVWRSLASSTQFSPNQ